MQVEMKNGLDLGVGSCLNGSNVALSPAGPFSTTCRLELQTQSGETSVLKPTEWREKNKVGKSPPVREWILLYKAFD